MPSLSFKNHQIIYFKKGFIADVKKCRLIVLELRVLRLNLFGQSTGQQLSAQLVFGSTCLYVSVYGSAAISPASVWVCNYQPS